METIETKINNHNLDQDIVEILYRLGMLGVINCG